MLDTHILFKSILVFCLYCSVEPTPLLPVKILNLCETKFRTNKNSPYPEG